MPVALVGIGALTPGAVDSDSFWRTVIEGRDLLTDVPPTHWLVDDYYDSDPGAEDKTYSRRGAFLSELDFDPSAYGIPPNVLPATDTAQLLALAVAESVLADVGRNSGVAVDRERVSVILGTGALDLLRTMSNRLQRPIWLKSLRECGVPESEAQRICDRIAEHYVPWQEATFPGVLGNVVAGRIANCFDLHGTNVTMDAACASSLAAVAGAVNELAQGTADMVITGGVDTLNDILTYLCFSKTPALSPTGDCRPFSDAADGTMLGEAVVMFALKRLADAERDGDRIYAVVRGIGSSSDGRGSAIYAPVPEGQARALRRAYEAAGYGPDSVELMESHGTGTKAGDLAEYTALRAVFDASGRPDRQWCALGSIKSQMGHTKSAAGAVGMLKAVLALQHKVLPPTIKVDRPNPELDLANGPLYLNTAARPWIKEPGQRRRAAVSSFGFGGTNFHVTLEEYQAPPGSPAAPAPCARVAPSELVLVSASSPQDLLDRARSLTSTAHPLATVAERSHRDFDPRGLCRLAIVAKDTADLAVQVRRAESLISADPAGPHETPSGISYRSGPPLAADFPASGERPGQWRGGVAWLFPGQGSQYVGMGADLAMFVPQAREAWDRAAELKIGDRPLHRVVFPIPAFNEDDSGAAQALLTQTEWAQPALAVQSTAQLSVLRALGMEPDCVAGHSFGELVALHAAGVMDEASLLRVARRRGELMRDTATEPGAMLVASTSRQNMAQLLSRVDVDGVWIANDNSPRQVVVAGKADSLSVVAGRLAEQGVTTRALRTAGAFHTPLMRPAQAPFADFLQGIEFKPPQIDVYGNVDARVYPSDVDRIRERVAEHLSSPIRFVDEIEAMYAAGIRTFIEVGAGTAVAGLVEQTLGDRPHLAVSLDRPGRNGLTALQEGLGKLATAGFELDLMSLWAPFRVEETSAEPRRARMSVRISGANYGSPYPPEGGAAALPPPNLSLSPAPGPETPADREPLPFPPYGGQVSADPLPSPGSTAGSLAPPSDVLAVFQEAQRQTAAAHAEFERTLADSHRAFLATIEASLNGLGGANSTAAGLAAPPTVGGAPVERPLPVEPSSSSSGDPEPVSEPVSGESVAVDVDAVLIEVIAEKTGFPVEVVDPHLELAADLGIDSIKRVEIFSALRKRIPALARLDLDVAELAGLRTVDQIVQRLRADLQSGAADPPASSSSSGASGPVSEPVSGDSVAVDVDAVLIEVIAEKTGFPVEVVDPHLELAADLGIDSIKRVEIFSALRKRIPALARLDLDVAELAGLRTVDQIAQRLCAGLQPGAADPPASSSAPSPDGTPTLPTVLVRSISAVAAAPLPGLELAGLREGTVAVTDEGTGVAERVAAKLREHGIATTIGVETGDPISGLIVLAGLRPVASADEAIALNREAFRIVRTAAPRLATSSGVLVTVQDTGGDFGLRGSQGDRAWLGGLAGLARTAGKEWHGVHAKAIDCERGSRDADAVADAVVDELLRGGSQQDVGLRADGTRWVLQEVDRPAAPIDGATWWPPTSDSAIVATGGARGVTAQAVHALAAQTPAVQRKQLAMVLVGRTALIAEPPGLADATDEKQLRGLLSAQAQQRGLPVDPATIAAEAARVSAVREIRGTLDRLEAAGVRARYVAVDVRDRAAFADALRQVRAELGPITGVIHSAGVLADGHLADKTDEQFADVFDTKVEGLRALLAATEGDPLRLVCVFSSVSGRMGNAGQSDYAMANEVISQVASTVAVARRDCVVRSIAWGPWDGGMVSPELGDRFRRAGTELIPLDAGAAALVREAECGRGPVRVTLVAGARPDTPQPPHLAVSGVVRPGADSHPYLADHAPAGPPVVPLALVLEWFVGAARIWRPVADRYVLRALRVLRRIDLDRFGTGGQELVIGGREVTGTSLDLDLSADSVPHYRGTIDIEVGGLPEGAWVLPESSRVPDLNGVYGSPALFHGPAFQAIETVETLGADGAAATVRGVAALGWPGAVWHTDPAAIDAGLQLALRWAEQVQGGAFLPMSVTDARVVPRGPVGPGARCVVRAGESDRLAATCDVALLAADSTPLVELFGVSLVRRTDGLGSVPSPAMPGTDLVTASRRSGAGSEAGHAK